MDNQMIKFEDFTSDELNAYRELQKKVQAPILEFEQMSYFPPMCLLVNQKKRDLFLQTAWELWESGNELLKSSIPENFRPYSKLEKEFSKEIAETKKYIKASDGNIKAAITMYSKDNPNIEIDDSDWR
jgi:uncharacterized protein YaaR (DUF327 family)